MPKNSKRSPYTVRRAAKKSATAASARAQQKARKYGGNCRGIDLLIYLNLQRRHFSPSGPFPADAEGAFVGWRSVSIVLERFAIVLWATANAPSFLAQRKGK